MTLDLTLTRAISGLSGRASLLDALGIFAATGLLIVLILAIGVLVVRMDAARRAAFLRTLAVSVIAAYAVSQLIGIVAFRSRPFVTLPDVRARIEKSSAEKSFPSDHATLAFALTVPALAFLPRRRWGRWARAVLLATATAIAFGRVVVGVHYVSDVVAGALLGTGSAWMAVRAFRPRARNSEYPTPGRAVEEASREGDA